MFPIHCLARGASGTSEHEALREVTYAEALEESAERVSHRRPHLADEKPCRRDVSLVEGSRRTGRSRAFTLTLPMSDASEVAREFVALMRGAGPPVVRWRSPLLRGCDDATCFPRRGYPRRRLPAKRRCRAR